MIYTITSASLYASVNLSMLCTHLSSREGIWRSRKKNTTGAPAIGITTTNKLTATLPSSNSRQNQLFKAEDFERKDKRFFQFSYA